MLTFLLLVIAAVAVQGAHSYLLFSQRANRHWSISDHAVKNRQTHLIYFLGHFVGGGAWLLATHRIFAEPRLHFIFWVSFATVMLEWLQAAVPSKVGHKFSWHAVFAYAMWLGCMTSIILGTILLQLATWQRLLAGLCCAAVFAMYIWKHFPRAKVYRLQYATIWCFFLGMLVLSF